ncbi:MAG: hypothetical protein ACYSRQ_07435 [Planctomycetota bacterium]|jgi:hypothetical protein
MEIIWITFIIFANVFAYIRKSILAHHGYKVAWLIIWGDWGNFMKLIEENKSSAKRRVLFAINMAPFFLFAIGVIVAFLDLFVVTS